MRFDQLREGKYDIWGLRRTKIIWNNLGWSFVNTLTGREIAYTNFSKDYPIGTHRWYFVDGKCQDFGEEWKTMNLHGCRENEFNCRSGDCVDLKERCDQNLDCRDGSDEQNCKIYINVK